MIAVIIRVYLSSILVVVVMSCFVSAGRRSAVPPLVSVRQTVLVSRGGRVDLRQALHFNLQALPQGTDCKITNIVVNGSSCGFVAQNVFDCRTYSGPILYQHFGCFSDKELATFMISVRPSNYSPFESLSMQRTRATIFSVELIVMAPHPILTALRVDAAQQENGALHLRVVFPLAMVGRCHYEVVSKQPLLSLPLAGNLEGAVNQPLPSGYVPSSPLSYHPHTRTSYPNTDYILVKIHLHKLANDTAYAILPFVVGLDSAEVEKLERDYLVIRQAVNTPVSVSSFHNLSLAAIGGHLLRYTFPVKTTGSFRSLYSTAKNVSHSVFTSEELLAGQVSFHPTDDLSSSNPFTYYVTDAVGVLIARGEVVVLAGERMWEWPSQRKNVPLTVIEGGVSAINGSTLSFYLLSGCRYRASMQVLRPPSYGELIYENGSRVGDEQIPLWVVSNTSLLRYRHRGGEELGDVMHWEVKCSSGPSLQVLMSVLVVPLDDAPPTLSVQSEVWTYQDWVFPLSPSPLHVMDPDSPRQNIHFTVHQKWMEGTLLRVFQDSSSLDNGSVLFPLLSFENIIPSIQRAVFYEVLEFSLMDLEQQKIWYAPAPGSEVDSIALTANDSINRGALITTLHIRISPHTPNQNLLISTHNQYPNVLRNKPIPLSEEGHMYLTPYFLYSQAPPSSPRNVQYVVQSPPQHGHLCSLSETSCTKSLQAFTQREINYHEIIYRSNREELSRDNFTFIVTVQGIAHTEPVVYTFNWTLARRQDTVVISKQFWIYLGSKKRIAAKFFRPLVSLLDSRNITFKIIEQPQYGYLILQNASGKPTSFTFADVLNRLLWYKSTQNSGPQPASCTDQIIFNATSPQSSVRVRLPLLLRRGEEILSVELRQRMLQGLLYFTFTTKDFIVSSSFCPEHVSFTVNVPPTRGQLNLKDHTYKTERELVVGSTFTAKDIQSGALSYHLTLSDLMIASNASQDGFDVSASDPKSKWPPPVDNRNANSNMGHFVVILIPSPNQEYILEVKFSSEHPLTWQPSQQFYGYAFTSSDIDLLNSTLQPHEVVVQVESGLRLGNLAHRDTPLSFFTMATLQAGGVFYRKSSLTVEGVFRDRVQLVVYAYLPGFSQRAISHNFVLEWAVVRFETNEVIALEEQGNVTITIRYGACMRHACGFNVHACGVLVTFDHHRAEF